MNNFIPAGLGLLGIGLLTVLCANYHRPEIEADLTKRTTAALNGILPADSASVSAEGQIVTLKGFVSTDAAKVKAGDEAAKVYGVSEVRNLLSVGTPKPPPPPPMSAEVRQAAENCQAEFTKLLQSEQIEFQSHSASISPASHRLLRTLAKAAAKCPSVNFEVGGHTDSRGLFEKNMELSQMRADAVVKYLVSRGVAASRMTAVGYGPNVPIAPNETVKGRRQNRRTEFKVKGL
jgi:OmpA-OmpF porin, OOP family